MRQDFMLDIIFPLISHIITLSCLTVVLKRSLHFFICSSAFTIASLTIPIFFLSSPPIIPTSRLQFTHSFHSNFLCPAMALQTACSQSSISSLLKKSFPTGRSAAPAEQFSRFSFSSYIIFSQRQWMESIFAMILPFAVMNPSSNLLWHSSQAYTDADNDKCASFSSVSIVSTNFQFVFFMASISLLMSRFMVSISFSMRQQLRSMGVTRWNLCYSLPKMQLAHRSFCSVQQQREMEELCYRQRIGFLERIRRVQVSIVQVSVSRAAIILAEMGWGCEGGRAQFDCYWGLLLAERRTLCEEGDLPSGEVGVLRRDRDFLMDLGGLIGFSCACIYYKFSNNKNLFWMGSKRDIEYGV